MDRRMLFNEDVANYDKMRPGYVDQLFEDIMMYAKVDKGMKVVEVGIGTGQATKPFLDKGCEVVAIELGEDLASYTREKYRKYSNLNVQNIDFETFAGEKESIDLVYSATAFHWIPEEVGYSKVMEMLKPNGALALFWNRPFAAREDEPLHKEIQQIYKENRPGIMTPREWDKERYQEREEAIRRNGFRDIEVKFYHRTRTFTAEAYIQLLNTYSDHRGMEKNRKIAFEKLISDAIVRHGNKLSIYDTMDLYLARK